MPSSLTDRLRRDERLKHLSDVFDNQKRMLEGLMLAEQVLWVGISETDDCTILQRRVARELVQMVKMIWDESAKDGERVAGA